MCQSRRGMPETQLRPTENSFNRTTQKFYVFLEFGSPTVERASLASSSGAGSKEEIVVFLAGKHSCRSKRCVFPMEQISREREREPVWDQSPIPRDSWRVDNPHYREVESSTGLLGTEKGVDMSWRRRAHHQHQENFRQKVWGRVGVGARLSWKTHSRSRTAPASDICLVQGVGSLPWTVPVTKKLRASPLTPTLEGSEMDKSRHGEQNLRAEANHTPFAIFWFPCGSQLSWASGEDNFKLVLITIRAREL